MIRLAVQSRLVPGDSLRDRYDNARRFGFDGMELSHFPMIEAAEEAIRDRVPVTAMCSGHRGWFIDPDPAEIAACRADVKRLLELGKGHLDWASVFGGLTRLGYDGWASMECNLSGPAESDLPASVQFVRARISEAEGAGVAA